MFPRCDQTTHSSESVVLKGLPFAVLILLIVDRSHCDCHPVVMTYQYGEMLGISKYADDGLRMVPKQQRSISGKPPVPKLPYWDQV